MNETTTRSDWTEQEHLFADVIINIVESKHKKYEREHSELGYQRVPLADIHFGIKGAEHIELFMNNIGIPHLQEIAKIQGNPDEEWKVTAQRMLDLFYRKGEIEADIERTYRLSKNGSLYKHLTEKWQLTS